MGILKALEKQKAEWNTINLWVLFWAASQRELLWKISHPATLLGNFCAENTKWHQGASYNRDMQVWTTHFKNLDA
jgi:hypothetical protein